MPVYVCTVTTSCLPNTCCLPLTGDVGSELLHDWGPDGGRDHPISRGVLPLQLGEPAAAQGLCALCHPQHATPG